MPRRTNPHFLRGTVIIRIYTMPAFVMVSSSARVGSENEVEFKPADSLFVPAGSGKIKINGHCTVVKTTV